MNKVLMVKCSCCGFELVKEEAVMADPWQDGTKAVYCSFECVEHVEEQIEDHFSSRDPE